MLLLSRPRFETNPFYPTSHSLSRGRISEVNVHSYYRQTWPLIFVLRPILTTDVIDKPRHLFSYFSSFVFQRRLRLFFSIHEPVNLLFRKLSLWSKFATKLVSTRKPSGRLSTDNRIDVKPSPFNRLFLFQAEQRNNKKVKEKTFDTRAEGKNNRDI